MRTILLCIALLAVPALAQPRANDRFDIQMPFDLRTALTSIRLYYQTNSTAERIDITLNRAGAERREEVLLRFEPAPGARDGTLPNFQLNLADYIIWSAAAPTDDDPDTRALFITHALDLKRFVRHDVPSSQSPLDALEAHFPTLPIPQLRIAYSRNPLLRDAMPYATDIEWSRATLVEQDGSAAIIIFGNTPDGASLRMMSGRALAFLAQSELRYTDDRIALTTTTRLETPPDNPALGLPTEAREQVQSISELGPRPADLSVGDALPPRALGPADRSGPRIILLAREWNESVRDAIADIRAAAEQHTNLRFEVLLTASIDSASNINERIEAWKDLAAPTPVRYASAQSHTIDRFAPNHAAAAVLVGPAETIRAIRTLPSVKQTADAPESEAPASWSSWLSQALSPAANTPE